MFDIIQDEAANNCSQSPVVSMPYENSRTEHHNSGLALDGSSLWAIHTGALGSLREQLVRISSSLP